MTQTGGDNNMPPLSSFPLAIVPEGISPRVLFDSLPSFRIGQDGFPLLQIQVWADSQTLFLQYSCFETHPTPQSGFSLLLFPANHPDGINLLHNPPTITITPHSVQLLLSPTSSTQELPFSPLSGENQQGIFWGGQCPLPFLRRFLFSELPFPEETRPCFFSIKQCI